jgi:hypothetical protein
MGGGVGPPVGPHPAHLSGEVRAGICVSTVSIVGGDLPHAQAATRSAPIMQHLSFLPGRLGGFAADYFRGNRWL